MLKAKQIKKEIEKSNCLKWTSGAKDVKIKPEFKRVEIKNGDKVIKINGKRVIEKVVINAIKSVLEVVILEQGIGVYIKADDGKIENFSITDNAGIIGQKIGLDITGKQSELYKR